MYLLSSSSNQLCCLLRRVEDFELHRRLYQGKASALYSATCKRAKLPVAVKVYRKARLSELNWYQVIPSANPTSANPTSANPTSAYPSGHCSVRQYLTSNVCTGFSAFTCFGPSAVCAEKCSVTCQYQGQLASVCADSFVQLKRWSEALVTWGRVGSVTATAT